jgi:hypothetical protein
LAPWAIENRSAQRNGSAANGGTGETPSQLCTIFGKTFLRGDGEATVRLEPVLGRFCMTVLNLNFTLLLIDVQLILFQQSIFHESQKVFHQ